MSYAATLTAKNKASLYDCFAPETIENSRAECAIKKNSKDLVFTIHARDAVAFRATTNAVSKLLTVYEKIEKL